jgi:tetratricopeptide (TPR) repeat protein
MIVTEVLNLLISKSNERFCYISPYFIVQLNAFAYSEEEYYSVRYNLMNKLELSTGSDKADALFELTRFVLPFEPVIADSLIHEQFKLSRELSYSSGTAGAFQNRGMLLYFEDDLLGSLENLMSALRLFKEDGNHTEIGRTYQRLLVLFHFTGNMDKVGAYYPRIISAFKKGNNQLDLAVSYYWMGYHHNNYDIRTEKAKQYLQKSIEICRKEEVSSILLAGLYGSLALAYKRANDVDSAIILLRLSNSYVEGNTDDERLTRVINYKDMGLDYLQAGQADSARFYFLRSISEANELSYLFTLSSCGIGLSQISKMEGNTGEALEYLEMAYQAAMEINRTGMFYADPGKRFASEWVSDAWPNIPKYFNKSGKKFWAKRFLRSASYDLSDLFKSTGNPDKALEYYGYYHAWSDSLNKISRNREMLSMQLEYETTLKDQQIAVLSQSNELKELRMRQYITILFGTGVFIVMIVALLLLLIRQRHFKAQQEKSDLEQKLLRSQMNPHFIFNSLSSVQNAILYNETDKAVKYLTRFGKLMRQILESSAVEKVSLADEIVTIENYLALQQIRFPDKFDYKIDVDERIDTEEVFIPPMLTQPFLENAVEHGIRHKSTQGEITVKIEQQNGGVVIMIQDDGVGRAKAEELRRQSNRDYKSMATAITQERIKVLNRKLRHKITMEIIDLKDEQGEARGTRVVFGVAV